MEKHVLIVGAGLSGLTCAYYLKEKGFSISIAEKQGAPGGRAFTDKSPDYLFDRGFQIFLDSYPEARNILDYSKLRLQKFASGALIWDGAGVSTFANPVKSILGIPSLLVSPWGTVADKVGLSKLLLSITPPEVDLPIALNISTNDYLVERGFSPKIMARLFRPFFGNVFLDESLQTDAGTFRHLLWHFTFGNPCLPANGLGAVAQQLADGQNVEYNVDYVGSSHPEGTLFVDSRMPVDQTYNAAVQWYFEADKSPLAKPILLVCTPGQTIRTLSVQSDVAPTYSRSGKALISITTLVDQNDQNTPLAILEEAQNIFGRQAAGWRLLKHNFIPKALPKVTANPAGFEQVTPLHLRIGDAYSYASINGAMHSGRKAAEHLIGLF